MCHDELDPSKLVSSSGVENNTSCVHTIFRSEGHLIITYNGKWLSISETYYVKVLLASGQLN